MAVPKWDDARTETLKNFVGDETPVSQATVKDAALELETSDRSVAAKLRKLGYVVETVANTPSKTFTAEEEDALRIFLEANEGAYTFVDIAENFAGGKFSPKQIQGKVLSMELTGLVKPAEKKVYERTYSDAEEKQFIDMANGGSKLEEIADALGRDVKSARGKALSLFRQEKIAGIPVSDHVAKNEDPFEGINEAEMTVEEIAAKIGRTARGVKTMLTRRGLTAKDYDGAAKKAKAEAKAS